MLDRLNNGCCIGSLRVVAIGKEPVDPDGAPVVPDVRPFSTQLESGSSRPLPCSGSHSFAAPPPGRPLVIDKSNVVAHADAVWIGRADSLIVADLSAAELAGRWEQLPAKRLDATRFQVCCIPFFAEGLALADEVTTAAGPDGDLVVASVVVASNHAALRVAFLAATQGEELAGRVIGAAAASGCLVERYRHRYLAIDVVTRSPELAGLTRLLDPLQDQGLVEYELSR